MKIAILLLAIIGFSFAAASASSSGLCLELDVKVYSSTEPKSQSFNIDMRKIKTASFEERTESFGSGSHIPLQEAGLVLEKKEKEELSQGHHQYLRNTGTEVWMPYAYAGDWYRNGYKISNQMTRTSTSKTVRPLVTFEFAYDPELKNISDADMNAILAALRSNSSKRQNVRKALHDTIMKNQNAYLFAKTNYDKVKKNNADLKKQIEEAEKKLKDVLYQIKFVEETITKLEKERLTVVSKKSIAEDVLTTKTQSLTIEKEHLVSLELKLKNFKPQSTTDLENALAQFLLNMSFPKNAPEEFNKEHDISDIKDKVNKSYSLCNNKKENAEPCYTQASYTNSKIKRRFF